ncbi:MAG TPA: substrate-binding domain-containing protein [Patescibacteria group bacterium]|nr:substrate-binding domain-containing protein [Patescibacteria group bacterium]
MFKFKGRRLFSILLTLVFVISFTAGCANGGNTTPTSTESQAPAAPKVIKIGMVTSKTGALQAYGEQTIRGFEMGLDYYTKGTNKIGDTEIQFIVEDSETKPEVAKQKAVKLFEEDKIDIIVGCASSSDALAIVPLAEEYQKVMVVEPAVADAITGTAWNKYIFRTGRNSSQDAAAAAAAIGKKGAKLGIFAPDSAFGHGGADAFKLAAANLGAEIVFEAYPPAESTDFTAQIQQMIAAKPEAVYVVWAGANSPWKAFMDLKVQEKGIKLSTGAPDIAALKTMWDNIGMDGFCVYYHGLPNNEVNDWMVKTAKEKYNTVPDLFDAGGFASAMAILTALEKSQGSTDAEKLIATMEGMSFETPKGTMTFRKEDHQALQVIYSIKLEKKDGFDYPVPVLVRELSPEETAPPITNNK